MSKCRLTRPLAQMGNVFPKGMILDGPETYLDKLVSEGKAKWVDDARAGADEERLPLPSPERQKGRGRGKKNG